MLLGGKFLPTPCGPISGSVLTKSPKFGDRDKLSITLDDISTRVLLSSTYDRTGVCTMKCSMHCPYEFVLPFMSILLDDGDYRVLTSTWQKIWTTKELLNLGGYLLNTSEN